MAFKNKKFKEAKKIEKISSCFKQVQDSVNQLIDNNKPWLNVKGVGPLEVRVSDANVLIGLKGGDWPYISDVTSSGDNIFPFKTVGYISGSNAYITVKTGMVNSKYIPYISGSIYTMEDNLPIAVTGNSGSVWVGIDYDATKSPTYVYLDGGATVPTSSAYKGIKPVSKWIKSGSGASASFGEITQYVNTGVTAFWCNTTLLWGNS